MLTFSSYASSIISAQNDFKDDVSGFVNNPDSAFEVNSRLLQKAIFNHDTTSQILRLIDMCDIKKNRGQYGEAFDHIWKAQLLAESMRDTVHLAECHKALGMLYGVFNQEQAAVDHMKRALFLRKELLNSSRIKPKDLISNYFGVAVRYSRSKKYNYADTYLDTCLLLAQRHEVEPYFILAERAYIAINQNELKKAETILNRVAPHFIDNSMHFEVMIHMFLGDLKMKQNKLDEALLNFNRCLDAARYHNTHTNVEPEVLRKIAEIYAQKGLKSKAYASLVNAKKLNDSLFSAKNNGDLLEIKNKYWIAIQRKNDQIQSQKVLLEERKQQNFKLNVLLVVMLCLLAIGILLTVNRYQRKRLKDNKYKARLKIDFEKKKHEEIVEVKNKEMTSYTLQLIDKEQAIDDLLKELKKHVTDSSYRSMRNNIKITKQNLWDEFNERFLKVNSDFYEKLKERYPDLTPTDLKHCALIKLNFSGKEMAQLLNISLPSVHIARHRIRKKFGLNRHENLVSFIGEI